MKSQNNVTFTVYVNKMSPYNTVLVYLTIQHYSSETVITTLYCTDSRTKVITVAVWWLYWHTVYNHGIRIMLGLLGLWLYLDVLFLLKHVFCGLYKYCAIFNGFYGNYNDN